MHTRLESWWELLVDFLYRHPKPDFPVTRKVDAHQLVADTKALIADYEQRLQALKVERSALKRSGVIDFDAIARVNERIDFYQDRLGTHRLILKTTLLSIELTESYSNH